MISLKFRSTISIAIICFVVGFCIAFLFMTNCGHSSKQPAITQAALLKAQADSLHAHYQAAIKKLKTRNEEISTELQSTKAELKAVKAKANSKAAEIKKIITPGYPSKELLKKATAENMPVDTCLQKCDSLAILVNEYIQETEQKDSLYEMQAFQQESLINGKDSVISLFEGENLNLSVMFKQSLSQQSLLEKNNILLRKKMKRQRAAGRWLTLGTAILSAVTTHYLSNR